MVSALDVYSPTRNKGLHLAEDLSVVILEGRLIPR